MKDFLEHEKKMCRHTQQIITPIYNAQKAFKDTNIYKTINNLIKQQQKLKETVESFRLINQIFDEYQPVFDGNLIN